jgi:hypothetical protein
MGRAVLYVTFDGVLQPLAFSQVVRVVVGLARRGVAYHLLSVERTKDVADRPKVARVEQILAEAGINWTRVNVDLVRSAHRSAEAFGRCVAAGRAIVRDHGIVLTHARGYQGAAVANVIRRIGAIPYLFDARGCWVDEKTDWFSNAFTYAAGKLAERRLYADAKAVVTLTELHRRDVVDGSFGTKDADVVVTIPTCADYDAFQIAPERPVLLAGVVPPEVQARLAGRTVLGIVGALNRSYLPEATLTLVKRACELRPDFHLLVLTQQRTEYETLLTAHGISPDRFTVASARHEDMPSWLVWIDWGLLLLADTIAKRGSMPTKLAEFFAAGVRPLAYGCNSEMTDWVRRGGSGIVLDAVSELALCAAAFDLSRALGNIEACRRAREVTEPHFSLASGVDRYFRLLERIL